MTETTISTTQKAPGTCLSAAKGAFWLSLVLLTLVLAQITRGQDYESLPISPEFIIPADDPSLDRDERRQLGAKIREVKAKINTNKRAVSDLLKTGSANFGPQGDLYVKELRLAEMTQTDEATLSKLGELRTAFLKDFLSRSVPPTARQGMIQKILPDLQRIATGEKFHPAVRINTITLISFLDTDGGDSNNPPVPSTAAYNVLKTIWSDNNAPPYVRVAAISGIRRFAEISRWGRNAEALGRELQPQLIEIVNGKSAGQGQWPPEMDYWLKRRATQILGYFGEGPELVAAASNVMKGEIAKVTRDNFWLRFDGLQALGNLKFDKLDRAAITSLIDDVIAFTAYAMEREAQWIQDEVADLVYINILYRDNDLESKDSMRSGPGGRERTPGARMGGPGASGGEGGFGGEDGGGPPRGGGNPREGSGFGGGTEGSTAKTEHVELPVFKLNESRNRVKAVLLTAKNFFKEEASVGGSKVTLGIVTIASPAEKKRIEEVLVPLFDELLEKTELGVIDYKKLKDAAPDNTDITYRLMQVYSEAVKTLQEQLPKPVGGTDP